MFNGGKATMVGFASITMLGYSLILIGIHMFIPHPSVTKKVIGLSYTSLALLALAQACIVATYFIPRISGACICNGLWSAALVFYVCGLYTLKFVYVERISILNKHPMLASEKIRRWIRYITASLISSCVISLIMCIALTDGECHEDWTQYGCKPTFHEADVYLAIVMIMVDSCLFAGFCYKWWGLIKVFKLSSDSKMLVEMIQSFGFQFILTCIALLSCVIDGIINLWFQDYSTLIVFCLDCAIVGSCDFAMIKESQAFMWKYVCWPCRMPSFILRGTEVRKLNSRTERTNTKSCVSEPSTTIKTTELTTNELTTNESGMQMTPQPPLHNPNIPTMVQTNSTQASASPPQRITQNQDDDIEIITTDDIKAN